MDKNKLISHFKTHETHRQIALFMFFGFFALVAELVSRPVLDLMFIRLDTMLEIWPFPEQALGSLLAFMISNLLAKVISYVFNRRKTFRANNNALTSGMLYFTLCAVLLVIETIIGTPLQNRLYFAFGGRYCEEDFSTISALRPGLYQLCGTLSQLIYCSADSIIMFFMNKYVIMRHRDDKAIAVTSDAKSE